MSPDNPFARLVKDRRTALGLSQAALAELVGRSGSAIRSWERGASTPTDENVVRSLAAVLGVDEATMRSSVGLPPDAPIEEPEEIGGDALEAFEEETNGEQERVEVDDVPGTPEESESARPEEPVGPDEDTAGGEVEDGPDSPAAEVGEESLAAEGEAEPAAPIDGESVEDSTGVVEAPTAIEGEPPRRDGPEAGDIAVPPLPGEPAELVEPLMPAAASRVSPTMTVPVAGPPPQPVEPSYLDDPDQMMTYWIRAAMTVAVTVFLLVVLFWAFGRLGDSIGEVWDIFKASA